ncbi:MAG: DNA-3-methyladenine glycosylase [Phycisphaerales bacterium]
MTVPRRWNHRDFALPADELAPALLGHRLVRVVGSGARLSGIIVETEAYMGIADRACHSFNGRRTPRTEPMYADAGTAYVYFTYGMHHCFNIVCGKLNEPVAVLIRALMPEEGLEEMRRCRRGTRAGVLNDTDLCSGPARLCQALDIDRRHSGLDMTSSTELFVEKTTQGARRGMSVERSARIGIASAGEWTTTPLRFFLAGNAHVSR